MATSSWSATSAHRPALRRGTPPNTSSFLVTDTARSDDRSRWCRATSFSSAMSGAPTCWKRRPAWRKARSPARAQLFHSLQRLTALPDYLQIWPGHGAGSACGKALGALPTSTLGYERRTNWAFGVDNESEFVAAVLEGQPPAPPYFARMKRLNRDGPPVLGKRDVLARLDRSRASSCHPRRHGPRHSGRERPMPRRMSAGRLTSR